MALRQRFIQTKFFRALLVVAFLSIFLVFQPTFIMQPLRIVLSAIAWPVQKMFGSAAFGLRDTAAFLTSIGALKRENEHLVEENVRLTAENIKWQSVSQENEVLRKEIGLLPRDRFQMVAAEVIGRDTAGLGNWLTIDRGLLQGIDRGMAVVVSGNVLIGRIVEVFPNSARVMLLSNPESLVSGITIEGSAQGIVKGEYGLGIVFDMVLQDAPLHTSDKLVTSGLGGELPKNLVIGTLQDPSLSADHLYQRASVVSLVTLDALRFVSVITQSFIP